MEHWQGKVALITGGSAGLGLALARTLVRAGARVALVGRDPVRLQAARASLPDEAEVLLLQADLTGQGEAVRCAQAAEERWSRLDLVVHSAGRSDRGRIAETPLQQFRDLWELNFLAAVATVQAALSALSEQRGHIVLIGSLASKAAPRFLGAYPASKFPVAALAQQLRLELAEQGVHVLLVCPGPLRRDDHGRRYDAQAAGLPEAARQPGGGARVRAIDPLWLSSKILRACEQRKSELVVPAQARWLFAIAQLWPDWGDWLLRRKTT